MLIHMPQAAAACIELSVSSCVGGEPVESVIATVKTYALVPRPVMAYH